jgi:hypothetical protein
MTVTPADPQLLDLTDQAMARKLPDAIHEARANLGPLIADMLAIPEAALETEWAWIGGGEEAVRYGLYRPSELFERAQIEAARTLRLTGTDAGLAAALIAPATAARWDLHGLLAPLTDALIDADPGGGEWTIRRTLGHIVNGQRAYGWGTAWWVTQAADVDDPGLPPRVSEKLFASLPDEEGPEQEGTLDDIRARLDAVLDGSAERLAGLPEDRLALGARWSGFPVTVGFRIGRWSSHIREHTIQVEKTLALLGRAPTEPERLVRLTLAAYGRAEAVVFGQPNAEAAADTVAAAAHQARETVADARRTAEA